MNFLKNLIINLKAKGPAAIIITWIISVLCIGIFGEGEMAQSALSILSIAGGMILVILASKS